MMGARDPSGVVWRPTESVRQGAALTPFISSLGLPDYDALVAKSATDPGWFWDAILRFGDVRFSKPYAQILDSSEGFPWSRWCVGGEFNLSVSCLDRQIEAGKSADTILIWEGEGEHSRSWTYGDLHQEVGRLANALKRSGIGTGDRVGLYMPPIPEFTAAILAIARIGAVAVPLFSGFGAAAAIARLGEVEAKAIISVDATQRRGKTIAIKPIVDEIVQSVPTMRLAVFVRSSKKSALACSFCDRWWDEFLAAESPDCAAVEVPADHPFVISFTSGTSGKPKGAVHTQVGLLAKAVLDNLIYDVRSGEKLLWPTDPGWLGATMRVLSSTLSGFTQIYLEGAPDYPGPDRLWRVIERHRVSLFGWTPTLIRSLMQHDDAPVLATDRSSLRVTFTSGEPSDPRSWMWVFDTLCGGLVPILNASGGTELGGNAIGTSVLQQIKPCAIGGSLPGFAADIVNTHGDRVRPGEIGELVFRQPAICMSRGLYNDNERYIASYWMRYTGMWSHSDLGTIDSDGFWYLQGRSDDALKIAGKRVVPAEIEAIILASGQVEEVAVVGVPDAVKGSALVCVCTLSAKQDARPQLADDLSQAVVRGLGAAFRPRAVLFTQELPKTRTGKIVRRVVLAALAGQPQGDLSSLANPDVVAGLLELRKLLNSEVNSTRKTRGTHQ